MRGARRMGHIRKMRRIGRVRHIRRMRHIRGRRGLGWTRNAMWPMGMRVRTSMSLPKVHRLPKVKIFPDTAVHSSMCVFMFPKTERSEPIAVLDAYIQLYCTQGSLNELTQAGPAPSALVTMSQAAAPSAAPFRSRRVMAALDSVSPESDWLSSLGVVGSAIFPDIEPRCVFDDCEGE